jgi:hypothetical protein
MTASASRGRSRLKHDERPRSSRAWAILQSVPSLVATADHPWQTSASWGMDHAISTRGSICAGVVPHHNSGARREAYRARHWQQGLSAVVVAEKIEIDVAGKYRVRVCGNFDGEVLRRVLDVLERR